MSKPEQLQPLLFVGVDWAADEHVAWWTAGDRSARECETVQQDPQAIADWIASLHRRFPNHRIAIALEQSRGALFVGLAEFPQIELYPINPKQLARYRESIYPSGGKTDPGDARLLAEFLQHAHTHLRPWQPDDTSTRQIGELVELRRKLVEQRKRLVSQLSGSLKLYFPQAEEWAPRKLYHPLMLDLLRRWPTLQQLQRVHPKTLRRFLAEHGMRNAEQQTQWIKAMRSARPLTSDQALIEPRLLYVKNQVQQIRDLNQAIEQFEEQLKKLTARHDDGHVFRTLPGAGEAMTPRLIAAFGSDRQRYDSAEQVQSLSGIAPITARSGKSNVVQKRYACNTFLRQTFHEFADHARRWSDWSRAFYELKRSQGMKHQAAVRALAYKWIRIAFRLWQDRTTYSEEAYIEQLKKTHSPVVNFLPPKRIQPETT